MACSSCQAKRILADPESYTEEEIREAEEVLAESRRTYEEMTLDGLYASAVENKTDLNEHVPKLRDLASQCDHVTDIGMRVDVSTVALLAGQPKQLLSVLDNGRKARPWMLSEQLAHVRGNTHIDVRMGNTPSFDLEVHTDLLFLDTKHTANQIFLELEKYAPRVRRYIVRHDTDIFGERGEDGGPGLRFGILEYVRRHPEWTIVYDTPCQYGLMVLSRDWRDKQKLPSVGRQVFNFTRHLLRQATQGADHVPDEVFNARLDTCLMCPLRVDNRCSKCGCYLDHNEVLDSPGKAAYASESCPINTWGKYEQPGRSDGDVRVPDVQSGT